MLVFFFMATKLSCSCKRCARAPTRSKGLELHLPPTPSAENWCIHQLLPKHYGKFIWDAAWDCILHQCEHPALQYQSVIATNDSTCDNKAVWLSSSKSPYACFCVREAPKLRERSSKTLVLWPLGRFPYFHILYSIDKLYCSNHGRIAWDLEFGSGMCFDLPRSQDQVFLPWTPLSTCIIGQHIVAAGLLVLVTSLIVQKHGNYEVGNRNDMREYEGQRTVSYM